MALNNRNTQIRVGHGRDPQPQFHEDTSREKKERNLRREKKKKSAKAGALTPSAPHFGPLGWFLVDSWVFLCVECPWPTWWNMVAGIGHSKIGRSRNWPNSKLAEVEKTSETPEGRSATSRVQGVFLSASIAARFLCNISSKHVLSRLGRYPLQASFFLFFLFFFFL